MTDALVIDERAHATALKALLNAALSPRQVYEYGEVPGTDGNAGTIPNIFALLGIERRYVEPTHSGRTQRSAWRITVRYIGRTVNEARWAAMKVSEALEARLVVDGVTSTPITHETTQAIALDDGRFAGWASFTYSL